MGFNLTVSKRRLVSDCHGVPVCKHGCVPRVRKAVRLGLASCHREACCQHQHTQRTGALCSQTSNGRAAYIMVSPFVLWCIVICVVNVISILRLRGSTVAVSGIVGTFVCLPACPFAFAVVRPWQPKLGRL